MERAVPSTATSNMHSTSESSRNRLALFLLSFSASSSLSFKPRFVRLLLAEHVSEDVYSRSFLLSLYVCVLVFAKVYDQIYSASFTFYSFPSSGHLWLAPLTFLYSSGRRLYMTPSHIWSGAVDFSASWEHWTLLAVPLSTSVLEQQPLL